MKIADVFKKTKVYKKELQKQLDKQAKDEQASETSKQVTQNSLSFVPESSGIVGASLTQNGVTQTSKLPLLILGGGILLIIILLIRRR